MKRLGIIIGVVFVIVVSPFVVQYGWNEIITTIIPVGKITVWQALGMIDDEYLMQSTGLVDKNGKEVFVGDIIKCTRGCLHEVYIEKEYGGTYFGGMPAVYLKDLREGYAWTEHEEIVGNIYENPELLEV